MRTREIIVISLFIITVCVVSIIPFSDNKREGARSHITTTPQATTTKPQPTTTPQATTAKPVTKITNNVEFLDTVIAALSVEPNPTNDKITIYKIQGMISSIKSQNVATLLGEIGNPNNLTDPRLFLQYMNWFGSNCPIDSDVCTGLSC
jgi:hypothetical protein